MRSSLLLLPVIALALGCSQTVEKTVVYPVSGKVVYGGKAAAGVQVFLAPTADLMPQDAPSNPHGSTGADGTFTITTYEPGDGAPSGPYQILLIWPDNKQEEENDIDKLYGWYDGRYSKLTTIVKEESNIIPTLELPVRNGPPPPIQGIPGKN